MPSAYPKSLFRTIVPVFLLSLLMISLSNCRPSAGKSFLPDLPGYDEQKRKVTVLPKKLLEISGHVLLDNDQLVAINDEKGELLFLDLNKKEKKIIEKKFNKKGDYEELVRINETYIVMESNGDLHFIENDSSFQYKFSRELKIEFEAMAHYPSANKLLLISKDHRLEEEAIYAFSFDLGSRTFNDTPYFKIAKRDISAHLKDFSAECKPSAAAIHPITQKLFIIASIGKVLLQCSVDGKVESAHQLNPAQFQQPEGISFASNGDMYISNEGLQGKATLIYFPFSGRP